MVRSRRLRPALAEQLRQFVAWHTLRAGQFQRGRLAAKSFALSEKLRVQFRFEAYNLFNTPYFGFPNANIGSLTAGQIRTTLADNRSLQGALKIEF